jgi:hypothetical protein
MMIKILVIQYAASNSRQWCAHAVAPEASI